MSKEKYMEKYQYWCAKAQEIGDSALQAELAAMEGSDIEDAFFKDLEFGTGGLRGVIAAGSNRMNIYTVAHASQGLANFVKKGDNHSIAIAYDSRNLSDVFSKVAAGVFAANGIDVYIYPELAPTPCLSFAVRYYKCGAGVVVTASHNPAKYNGYKVYGPDGCQITSEMAAAVSGEIAKLDVFGSICKMDFDEGVKSGKIHIIGPECMDAFVANVKAQSVLYGAEVDRNVDIVYTPLNGSGLKPVTRTLREAGFNNIFVVPEQEMPDGNFPTCPYPNPEIRQALELGLKYADERGADLLIATDPDSDRMGAAVRGKDGMQLISGNDMGVLLVDYVCQRRAETGHMPENPLIIKTIVTSTMADAVARSYGVGVIDLLTGFKYIGEQITKLESQGQEGRCIFGFEESYGYLAGTYVRDKDGVNGAFMLAEMFAYYKSKGISIAQRLEELYAKYGYRLNVTESYQFEGAAGFAKMQEIMQGMREPVEEIAGLKVLEIQDYAKGFNGLPASDVVKFILEGENTVVVRPSGTEPKIKLYISTISESWEKSQDMEIALNAEICKKIQK